MLKATLKAQAETVSNASYAATLLDGVSLYGISGFNYGRLVFPVIGLFSEGLIPEYGQGAPFWGDWAMYSDGTVGVDFLMEWDLTGAGQPTTYSLISGALPDGLSLSSVSGNLGRISGIPTATGTFNFTLRATNSFGTDDKAFSIVIVAAPGGAGGAFTFIG